MTWLVLRYWYGYHRAKFAKWSGRKNRILDKQGHKTFRQRRVLKVWAKRDHHAWWLNHYCELMSAYGHKIDGIHFGEGENTIQSNFCPYKEDVCVTCDGKIELRRGEWEHYLSEYSGHEPIPMLAHWPHVKRSQMKEEWK